MLWQKLVPAYYLEVATAYSGLKDIKWIICIKAVYILPSRGKSTAGATLPLGEPDWLNWSCGKDDTLGLAYGFVMWPKILNLNQNPKPGVSNLSLLVGQNKLCKLQQAVLSFHQQSLHCLWCCWNFQMYGIFTVHNVSTKYEMHYICSTTLVWYLIRFLCLKALKFRWYVEWGEKHNILQVVINNLCSQLALGKFHWLKYVLTRNIFFFFKSSSDTPLTWNFDFNSLFHCSSNSSIWYFSYLYRVHLSIKWSTKQFDIVWVNECHQSGMKSQFLNAVSQKKIKYCL